MLSRHKTSKTFSILAACSLLVGCVDFYSGPKQAGQEGELEFSTDRGATTGLARPIAVGAELTVRVDTLGDNDQFARLERVHSEMEEILSISSWDHDKFVLLAHDEGTSTIEVEAGMRNGSHAMDRLEFSTRHVSTVELNHRCVLAGSSTYLAGGRGDLGLRVLDVDGKQLAGQNYAHLNIEPSQGGSVVSSSLGSSSLSIHFGNTPGTYTLNHERGAESLEFEVVETSQIDGLLVEHFLFTSTEAPWAEGHAAIIGTLGAVDGEGVCGMVLDSQARVLTEESCTVEAISEASGYLVTAIADGRCAVELEAELPDGSLATAIFEIGDALED